MKLSDQARLRYAVFVAVLYLLFFIFREVIKPRRVSVIPAEAIKRSFDGIQIK